MAGASPDPNPNAFDSGVILSALTRFFGLLPQTDQQVLNTLFEQTSRALDDYYHEMKQINDSKEFLTLQPLFQRDWLLRDLSLAEFIGTPHGHFDFEVTAAGGETEFAVGRPLDQEASRVWFDGVEVPQGSGWDFDTSDPLAPKIVPASPAIAGTVVRCYGADVEAVAQTVANGTQTTFAFPQQIDPARVKIYHNNIELTRGIEIRRREVLFYGGLTGGTVVRFQNGAKTHNVTAASGQVKVTVPFDIMDGTLIKLNSINIRDGWVITADDVTFKTAPRSGVTIRITAPKVVPHDHLSHSAVATAAQTVFVTPAILGLGTALAYDVDRPILVFVNGQLIAQTYYSFTDVDEITFGAGLFAGDEVLIYYHTTTAYSHAHPPYEQVLTEDLERGVGVDLGFLDADKPALVMLDGLAIKEGSGANAYQYHATTIVFGQKLPAGTRITVVAEKFQWRYKLTEAQGWSRTIKFVESIQNGIDLPTIVLTPPTGFTIYDNTLYLDQVFTNGWLKNVQLDLEIPFSNFGTLINFAPTEAQNPQEYVDLLKALWAAFTGGQAEEIAEDFGRIMLGSPYAQFPGVTRTVEDTGGGNWVVTIEGDDAVTRSFALTGMDPAVVPGTRVGRFTALGDALSVIDDANTPDWYLTQPAFLYAVERLSTHFDTAALFDKGLRSTYRVTATDPYDVALHSIDISLSSFDFRLLEDLNNQQRARCTLFFGATRYDSRVLRVEELSDRFRVFLDPAYTFTGIPGTNPAVEFEFERQRRHDLDFLLDEYLKEHLDPVAAQVYSVLKHNLFLVQITKGLRVDQERMELLFLLLDRIKAVETNYIIVGAVSDQADDLPMAVAEDDPTTGTNFSQIPAFIGSKLGAYGINYYGP